MVTTEFLAKRQQLRASFKALLPQALPANARAGAWSPRQAYAHVLLTNQSSQALLQRLFQKAKDLREEPTSVWPVRLELLSFSKLKAFSIEAFPGTEPTAVTQSVDALENQLETGLAELLKLTERYDLESLSFPHPLAGRLNFYEWLAFGLVHEQLHFEQVKTDLAG